MNITQPVLLQSLKDKVPSPSYKFDTLVIPGQVLGKMNEGQEVCPEIQREYRGGLGKLLHLISWPGTDIWNAAKECARIIFSSNDNQQKEILRLMKYCVDTQTRG